MVAADSTISCFLLFCFVLFCFFFCLEEFDFFFFFFFFLISKQVVRDHNVEMELKISTMIASMIIKCKVKKKEERKTFEKKYVRLPRGSNPRPSTSKADAADYVISTPLPTPRYLKGKRFLELQAVKSLYIRNELKWYMMPIPLRFFELLLTSVSEQNYH